jgi:hypothetical protein
MAKKYVVELTPEERAELRALLQGGKARVRIGPCGGDPAKLCGAITWSYQPEGAGPQQRGGGRRLYAASQSLVDRSWRRQRPSAARPAVPELPRGHRLPAASPGRAPGAAGSPRRRDDGPSPAHLET